MTGVQTCASDLVVTHERDLVNRFSKRVVAIKDGEMIRDGQGGYYRA